MGILERIDARLSMICVVLGINADDIGAQLTGDINQARAILAGAAANATVGATAPVTTGAQTFGTPPVVPVSRLTVVQALAAGNVLTGNEVDEQGCFWDRNINTEKPAVTQKNIWKRGKNIDNTVYDNRIAEIKAQVNAERAAAATTTTTPATAPTTTAATTPSLPAVGGLPPLPGVPGAGLPPVPGVGLPPVPGAGTPTVSPARARCIELTNVLTERYEISFEAVQQLYIEMGSADGGLQNVPTTNMDALASRLNNWTQILDWIDEAQAAVLSLNGGDSSFTAIICQQLQVGTTDLADVAYSDIYRVYQGIHQYQNTLEQHWQKPLTAIKTLAG